MAWCRTGVKGRVLPGWYEREYYPGMYHLLHTGYVPPTTHPGMYHLVHTQGYTQYYTCPAHARCYPVGPTGVYRQSPGLKEEKQPEWENPGA